MKKVTIACMAALSVCLPSCSSDGETPVDNREPQPIRLTVNERTIVSEANALSPTLLSGVLKHSLNDDVAVSPLSATIYFSMLANAAEGEDRDRILELLGSPDIDELNTLTAHYLEGLPLADPARVDIALANNVWFNADFESSATTDFLQTLSTLYGVEPQSLPFASKPDDSAKSINRWISDNTDGLITNFYSADELRMVPVAWVNTLYFKGKWSTPFDASKTHKAKFHDINGQEIGTVDMMTGELYGAIISTEKGTTITVPYGNNVFEMTLFVPADGITLEEGAQELLSHSYGKQYSIKLSMPKFKINWRYIVDTLLDESVKDVELANVHSKYSDPLRTSDFTTEQSVVIEVDEQGTKAAAVTGSTGLISPGPVEMKEFVIDRQFVFMIKERASDAILFMGAKRRAN